MPIVSIFFGIIIRMFHEIIRHLTLVLEILGGQMFAKCFVESGALAWPNGYELCPDAIRGWISERRKRRESSCVSILGAQMHAVERLTRRSHDRQDQLSPDAGAPVRREHVQMTYAPDSSVTSVRVDVEATDADDATLTTGSEQHLAGSVESIETAVPFLDQSSNKSPSILLTVCDQFRKSIGGQVQQCVNHAHEAVYPNRSACALAVRCIPVF